MSDAAQATAAPVQRSKAQKLLRRTLSGGALAGSIALLLWWAAASGTGEPVLWVTSLVLLAAVWEVSRMGALASRALLGVLGVPALILIALHLVAARWPQPSATLLPASSPWRADYLHELALVGLGAAASFAFVRGGWWRPRSLGRVALGILALAVLWGLLRNQGDAGLVVGLLTWSLLWIAVCTLPAVLAMRAGREWLIAVGLALWLLPPLPWLWQIWRGWGTAGLVALLVLSKIGDTAGYYVGSAIGRRHPFPNISPGKTVAGCVASLVAATAVGGVFVQCGLLPDGRWGLAGGLLLGALLNLAAQAGDLFESWIKRRAGVKDSSTCFGPSGGLLDQLDSVLFSIPVGIVLFPLLFPAE